MFPGVARDGDAVLKIEDLGISFLIAESNLINARIADRLYATLEDAKIMKALRG